MKIQDLTEAMRHLEEAEERLQEMEAQAANERVQFGDSWPGSDIDIREAGRNVAKLQAEVNRLRAMPLQL